MVTAMAERSIIRSSAFHMAFGFVLMGGWALFANRAHGLGESWLPALAQGTISALLTGIIKKVIEWLDGQIAGLLAYAVPPFITAGSILVILYVMHTVIGTPEVAATIAFPWSISTIYAIVYTAGLVRARRTP